MGRLYLHLVPNRDRGASLQEINLDQLIFDSNCDRRALYTDSVPRGPEEALASYSEPGLQQTALFKRALRAYDILNGLSTILP